MDLTSTVLGRRNFVSKRDIINVVRHSSNYNSGKENLKDADALLIFKTSNQQTWIVSTNERLYCILDDVRKDTPHINWSDPKEQHVSQNMVITKIRVRDKSEKTGLVDIGANHRNWYFSKDLFRDEGIEKRIQGLIASRMSV